jgi:transposase
MGHISAPAYNRKHLKYTLEVLMKIYHNFVGIAIGKFNFTVAVYNHKETKEFENNPTGIAKFFEHYNSTLKEALCIVETTGGYEVKLLIALYNNNFSVHRANTRKVKNYILSFGNGAKTDILDAKSLALKDLREKISFSYLFLSPPMI